MYVFDKLSVKQILVFSEIIAESSLMQMEFIRAKYQRSALNFNETVEFLKELKLIAVRRNQILPKPKYQAFLQKLIASREKMQILQSFLIDCLFLGTMSFSEYIGQFMANFRFKNGQYEFVPTASQRLAYSGLRNYLIDLGFLHVDAGGVKYVVGNIYPLGYPELARSHRLTPEEFADIQQKNREIGRKAELQVIEYEKQRLSLFPHLVEKIEHVADWDIAAGYDVKSFEDTQQENPIPRLIEVKAVSPWNYRFNWTRNEIETSKLHQQNYHLYLVPVLGKDIFDFEGLRVIRNPYSKVYKNKKEWLRSCEILSFCDPNLKDETGSTVIDINQLDQYP